ncbi:MAG: rod shape-determining protein MreD [Paramuribaculum sp.]|nr:rod shape-determining protein MreD [Paramuribaculum sp.]MDE7448840.1 rod shape-determining protein MreD [Paramuribaculum sp.]
MNSRLSLNYLLGGLLLVIAQVVVFNHICLFGVAVPFAFIYIVLRLPLTMSVNWVMTIAFIMGLIVDVFSDTPGMNTLACTILATTRKTVVRLYFPREDDLADPQLTLRTLGTATYLKYVISMALIYCALIFIIEAFDFFNPLRLVLRIICSTALTSLVLIGIDSLTLQQREKRL